MDRHVDKYAIVLVEDNPGDIALVKMALEEMAIPAALHSFTLADEARDHFRHTPRPPDLLLLDINLVDGNGLDLLADLRSWPSYAGVCTAVLSSSVNRADREWASRLGVVRFVCKPADLDEFLSTVGGTVQELLSTTCPNSRAQPTAG